MTPKTVNKKIDQMISWYGSHRRVAEVLDIELSYVYKLKSGFVPGRHLYREIRNARKPEFVTVQ